MPDWKKNIKNIVELTRAIPAVCFYAGDEKLALSSWHRLSGITKYAGSLQGETIAGMVLKMPLKTILLVMESMGSFIFKHYSTKLLLIKEFLGASK